MGITMAVLESESKLPGSKYSLQALIETNQCAAEQSVFCHRYRSDMMASSVMKIYCACLSGFLGAILLSFSSAAISETVVSPFIDASISYTDNVSLASSDATSSAIYQLMPGVNALFDGRHMDIVIDYRFESLYFSSDGDTGLDRQQYYHHLNAGSEGELAGNALFLNTNFSIYQYASSASGLISTDNFSLADERITTKQADINPYIATRFGEYANLRLDYSYGYLTTDRDNGSDVSSREYKVSVDSGDKYQDVQVSLNTSSRSLDYESDEDQRFTNADIGVDYDVAPGARLLLRAGYEENEYVDTDQASTEGEYWSVGINKSFGQRTNLLMRYGERYYGDIREVRFNHRSQNANWLLSYAEDITTRSQIELETQLIDIAESIIDQFVGNGGLQIILLPVFSTEVIERNTVIAELNAEYRKLTGDIRYSRSEYEYQQSLIEESIDVISLSLGWKLSPRTEFTLSNLFQRRANTTTDIDEQAQELRLAMKYLMARNATLSITGGKNKVISDIPAEEYTQNITTLGLNILF